MPRWSEEPDHVLGMISNYLRVEDPEQAPDRHFRAAAACGGERIRSSWSAPAPMAGGAPAARADPAPGPGTVRPARTAQVLHRQGPRRNAPPTVAGRRRTGARRGYRAPDDVFFWTSPNSGWPCGAPGCRPLSRAAAACTTSNCAAATSRGCAIGRDRRGGSGNGKGTALRRPRRNPCFGRTATGTVRVILDPVGARLEPGEILVVPSTDPGWTPLFMTAGALVMEMGGVISHGAVVAREYGIPAVVVACRTPPHGCTPASTSPSTGARARSGSCPTRRSCAAAGAGWNGQGRPP